jgi:hypothetical protein
VRLLLLAFVFLAGIVIFLFLRTPAPLSEGVYQLCNEVSGFSGETLELKGGKFRYWFYSDVVSGSTKYPLSGSYSVWGNTLVLLKPELLLETRTIAELNGVNVLWRGDGLKLWKNEKRIQPYAVLIQNPLHVEADQTPEPPSVEWIYTDEMRSLRKKRHEQRFNDQPAEVRAMLRARTLQGDEDLSVYRAEILKARIKPDPNLIQQLVALLGYNNGLGVDANMILEDIYLSTHLMPDEPATRRSKDELQHALGILIDGFSVAPDRSALEAALLIYLRASRVGKMLLEIPEGGVRLKLEAADGEAGASYTSTGSESFGERSKHPLDHNWREKMKIIIPVCQQWAREQLKK